MYETPLFVSFVSHLSSLFFLSFIALPSPPFFLVWQPPPSILLCTPWPSSSHFPLFTQLANFASLALSKQ